MRVTWEARLTNKNARTLQNFRARHDPKKERKVGKRNSSATKFFLLKSCNASEKNSSFLKILKQNRDEVSSWVWFQGKQPYEKLI